MKHIIKFWPGYLVKHMAKTNLAVGMNNCLDNCGIKKQLVHPFRSQFFGDVSVEFYWNLPMGIKSASFGGKLPYIFW